MTVPALDSENFPRSQAPMLVARNEAAKRPPHCQCPKWSAHPGDDRKAGPLKPQSMAIPAVRRLRHDVTITSMATAALGRRGASAMEEKKGGGGRDKGWTDSKR